MLNYPEVIFEDNHLLVLDKPPGWIVQGASAGDHSLLEWGKSYLKENYRKPGNVFLAAVSRLDRGVSGVVPLARTSKAAARLNEQIRSRQVKKIYTAIVAPPPKESSGTLRHYLARDEQRAKSIAYDAPWPDTVEAILKYEVSRSSQIAAELRVELITGRKHQIRAQLSAAGWPIMGDLKYGAIPKTSPLRRIALHCNRFELVHPTRDERLAFNSPAPWLEFKL